MSEFSEHDYKAWLQLAIKNDCSVYKAIHFTYFWSTDINKINRAFKSFCAHYYIDDGLEVK